MLINLFRRGLISIGRRKQKSLILLLIIFILGNIMLSAMLITQSVDNTRESIVRGLPPVVSLEFSPEVKSREDLQTLTLKRWKLKSIG